MECSSLSFSLGLDAETATLSFGCLRLPRELGVNSIGIMNFGHKTGRKAGQFCSKLSSRDMSQNAKDDLGQVLGLILGPENGY